MSKDLYYSEQWQVLEERYNGAATDKVSNVWGTEYVNALVCRDFDANSNGALESGERLWSLYDANYNVTALVTPAGAVQQRFVYDPYGVVTVLDASWAKVGDGSAANAVQNATTFFQGGRYDTTSGLYTFQNRDYTPTLQRWTERDPAGYKDGMDLYAAFGGAPVGKTDPNGLAVVPWDHGVSAKPGAEEAQPVSVYAGGTPWYVPGLSMTLDEDAPLGAIRGGSDLPGMVGPLWEKHSILLTAPEKEDAVTARFKQWEARVWYDNLTHPNRLTPEEISYEEGKPGFWESIIPIWGVMRRAKPARGNGLKTSHFEERKIGQRKLRRPHGVGQGASGWPITSRWRRFMRL